MICTYTKFSKITIFDLDTAYGFWAMKNSKLPSFVQLNPKFIP